VDVPTPKVILAFTAVVYDNPPDWACQSQIVNACLICTNTSAGGSIVQVNSPIVSGRQLLNFTIPAGGGVRSCGNTIFLPVFPSAEPSEATIPPRN
jgi:hypothetical protein